jgi:hypothetical protein
MSVGHMSIGQKSFGQMFVGQNICLSDKILVTQISIGQMSVGQICLRQKVRRADVLAKYMSTKCLSTKCLSVKWFSTKRPRPNFPSLWKSRKWTEENFQDFFRIFKKRLKIVFNDLEIKRCLKWSLPSLFWTRLYRAKHAPLMIALFGIGWVGTVWLQTIFIYRDCFTHIER